MTTIAGETQDQTIARLESDVAALEGDLKRAETARDEAKEMRDNLQQECDRQQEELNFLREQIAELALQITSPSAPSHKSDMARLLEGLLAKVKRMTAPRVGRVLGADVHAGQYPAIRHDGPAAADLLTDAAE